MNIQTFTQIGSDGVTTVEMVKIDDGVTATIMTKETYDLSQVEHLTEIIPTDEA